MTSEKLKGQWRKASKKLYNKKKEERERKKFISKYLWVITNKPEWLMEAKKEKGTVTEFTVKSTLKKFEDIRKKYLVKSRGGYTLADDKGEELLIRKLIYTLLDLSVHSINKPEKSFYLDCSILTLLELLFKKREEKIMVKEK